MCASLVCRLAIAVLGALVATGLRPAQAADVSPLVWSPAGVVDDVHAWAAEGPDGYWGLASGRVEAPADVIFRRISDFESLPRMYPRLNRVRVLDRGEATALVYFHYDLPWPLADRSYTAWHRWWTESSGTIVLDVHDANALGPPDDGAVRVERVLTRLTFTPASGGAATDVEYLFRADLAGMLPRRIRAQAAWKIPLNAVLAMRRSLEPRYAMR